MPIEKTQAFLRVCNVYSDASGLTVAGSKEKLLAESTALAGVVAGLRIIAGGTSPLADEIEALIPAPASAPIVVDAPEVEIKSPVELKDATTP